MSDRILVLHEGRDHGRDRARRRDRGGRDVRGDRQAAPTTPDAPSPTATGAAPMAEAARRRSAHRPRRRRVARAVARQRELSLRRVMVVLGAVVVAIQAPQFLSASNLTQVAVLASIIAIAAVGEAMVVITRNVDLSVEAVIGPGRLRRRRHPRAARARRAGGDRWSASAWASSWGWSTAFIVDRPPGAVDRRDAGHAEHLPRHRLLHRGRQAGHARRLPAGYTDAARATFLGIPMFVVDRRRRRRHRVASCCA